MALLLRGKTECALCGEVIGATDEVVGTQHFISDPSDTFFRYSDAVLHKTCFEAWEQRAEFLARYEEHIRRYRRST